MGYIPPPSGIVVLPKDVTFQQFDQFKADFYDATVFGDTERHWLQGLGGQPQMVIRPIRPSTYAEYRRGLYGAPPMDWLPFLNAALLGSVIALIAAILWALA